MPPHNIQIAAVYATLALANIWGNDWPRAIGYAALAAIYVRANPHGAIARVEKDPPTPDPDEPRR